ncbi:MAG: hypothetical protein NTX50_12780 [Candidatus Sumerlaeota bacterium]|nr:hypothetical protein [Candidatus Sumerlaeota bacterium]
MDNATGNNSFIKHLGAVFKAPDRLVLFKTKGIQVMVSGERPFAAIKTAANGPWQHNRPYLSSSLMRFANWCNTKGRDLDFLIESLNEAPQTDNAAVPAGGACYAPEENACYTPAGCRRSQWRSQWCSKPSAHTMPPQAPGLPRISKEKVKILLSKYNQCYLRWLLTLPKAHVAILDRNFPIRQWSIYSTLSRVSGFDDLCLSNPALALMIANCWVFLPQKPSWTMRTIRRLVAMKQADALALLEFPQWSRKIIRKVNTLQVRNIVDLLYLRNALQSDGIAGNAQAMKLLRHAPRVNSSIIYLLRPEIIEHITPHLITDILAHRPAGLYRYCGKLISDNDQMWQALNYSGRPQQYLSADEVSAINYEMKRQIELEKDPKHIDFLLPPPFPGTPQIVPITNTRHLLREARNARNCCYSERYIHDIQKGESYLYSVDWQGEHATCEIQLWACGVWRVEQLKGPRNSRVSRRLSNVVEHYFEWAQQTPPPDPMFFDGDDFASIADTTFFGLDEMPF